MKFVGWRNDLETAAV